MRSSRTVVTDEQWLSPIVDAYKVVTELSSQGPMGGSDWGGSSFSLCSNRHVDSSNRFSIESLQPDAGDDCAAIVLACLYCQFYDIIAMVPDTCERAVRRCFPSFQYLHASSDQELGRDGRHQNVEPDCSCCSSCQEGSEFIELAMEISEVCYR